MKYKTRADLLQEIERLQRRIAKLEAKGGAPDITERKRTEEEASRMVTVVRDSNDAITIQDFEGKILAWNRGAELMYGYSEEEALQKNIWLLTPPGREEEQKDFTRRMIAGEAITSLETQRKTKDGRILDVWMTVTKLVDDAGKPIGIASTERDITMRKRKEEEASRMVTVVRDSNDAITIQDFEGKILAWNRGAELMYGYSEEEALHKNIWLLTPPGREEEQKDFTRRMMAGEAITSLETQRKTKDGRILDVWMTVTKLVDDTGKPIGIASTERDITMRKRAEKDRDLLINLSADLICVAGMDGFFKFVNPAWKTVLGYSREELLSKPFLTFIHPEDHHKNDEEVANLASGETTIGFENRYIHKDKSIRTIFWTATPLLKEKVMYCIGRDITERKRMEEALASSERFLSSIIEQSPLSMWISDSDGTLIKMNQACRELFGATDEEVVGKYNILKDNVIEEQGFMPLVENVFEKGEVARFTLDYDLLRVEQVEVKKSTHTILDVVVSPIKDMHGKVTNALVQHKDITERKRAEQALQASDALLQSAINILPVGLWIIDAEGKIVTSSAAAQRIWAGVHYVGIDQLGEYKGWRTDSGKLIEAHEWAGARALEKGETSIEEEVEIECFDGTHKIILDSAVPLRKSDGSIGGAITINQDITERRRAVKELQAANQQLAASNQQLRATEQQLRASNQQLEAGMERLAEAQAIARLGSWEYDAVKDVINGSDEFHRLFGVGHDRLRTYQAFIDLLHPDDREHVGRDVQESLTKKALYDTEYRVRLPNGDYRDIHARGRVFADEAGKPVHMVGTCLDITERKRAEVEILESNATIRSLVDAVPESLFLMDPDGTVRAANEIVAKRLGRTVKEIEGQSIWETLPPEVTRSRKPLIEAIIRSGKPDRFEDKRGDSFIDNIVHPVLNEQGQVSRVAILGVDITERKRAEKSLQESELKFREIVQYLDEGYYNCTADGRLQEHNRAFNRILGFDLGQDLKGSLLPDFWQNPDDRKEYLAELMSRGFVRNFLIDAKTIRGEKLIVMANSHLVKDEKGTPVRIEGTFTDFTERKRAEKEVQAANQQLAASNQQLRATEQQLRASNQQLEAGMERLAEAQAIARLGSWEYDAVKDVISGSDEFHRLFGVGHEQLRTYQAFLDLLHPDDREHVGRDVQESLTKKALYDTEYRVRLPNGDYRDIHARGRVFADKAGKTVRMVGTCLDITERKRAEDALRESESKFKRLYDSNIIGVIFWDTAGNIIQANGEFLRIVGYTEDDVLSGRACWKDMTPPEYAYLDEKAIKEMTETGISAPFEKEYIRKDGSKVPIRLNAALLKGERDIGICFIQDITERKRAEDTLKIGKDRLLFATEGANLGVWNWNTVTGELIWSDKCKAFFGIRPDETMSYQRYSDALHPDDRERTDKAVQDALDNHTDYDIEYRSLWPDGSIHWLAARGRGYYDAAGKAVRLEGVVLDIAARKRMEDELRKYRDELEQRVRDRTAQLEETNKEMEAFSYSVSHDLRAPLRAIDGFTSILADDYGPRLNTEGKRVCSVIHDNTIRMGRLIDDLLAFSRLGRAEMQPSRIDMGTMANSMFHELTTPESRERIDFQVGSLPAAVGDSPLMRQVWTNLLGNAVKFSSKRERAIIKISGERREGEIVYAVQDNGAGFDMRYIDKLFGVFQRLHSTREFEGTGVGLALVQRVIRRHGGRVWAEGETDRGATFYFTLPRKGA